MEENNEKISEPTDIKEEAKEAPKKELTEEERILIHHKNELALVARNFTESVFIRVIFGMVADPKLVRNTANLVGSIVMGQIMRLSKLPEEENKAIVQATLNAFYEEVRMIRKDIITGPNIIVP